MAVEVVAADTNRQVRVGLVLAEPLSRTADPVEYDAYRGLVRAARNLHIQDKAVAWGQTSDPFGDLARQHYVLIFARSDSCLDSMRRRRDFPM